MLARSRQDWITKSSNIIQNNKAFSRALMRSPQLQRNLENYLRQLQRAVDRGQFTPKRAFAIFRRDTNRISQILQQQSKRATAFLPPDPNDLTKPLNMVNALNNPNSYASQMAADAAGVIAANFNEIDKEVNAAINQEMSAEEMAEEQSAENIQQESITETQNQEAAELSQPSSDTGEIQNQSDEQGHFGKELREACEVVTVGILEMGGRGLADAEKIADKSFEKVGELLGMDTSEIDAGEKAVEKVEEKVSSPFDMKLEPPKE